MPRDPDDKRAPEEIAEERIAEWRADHALRDDTRAFDEDRFDSRPDDAFDSPHLDRLIDFVDDMFRWGSCETLEIARLEFGPGQQSFRTSIVLPPSTAL